MADYATNVAAGRFKKTAAVVEKVLGRSPHLYAQWLERNLPNILARAI
jgi:hypothetical protein